MNANGRKTVAFQSSFFKSDLAGVNMHVTPTLCHDSTGLDGTVTTDTGACLMITFDLNDSSSCRIGGPVRKDWILPLNHTY